MVKRDQLRDQLKSSKNTIQKYKHLVEEKNQEMAKLAQYKESKLNNNGVEPKIETETEAAVDVPPSQTNL